MSNMQQTKDNLIELLDQTEIHIENLRRDAAKLNEEKEALLTTLDTLKSNETLHDLQGGK